MMDSLRFNAHKKFIKFNAEKSEVLEKLLNALTKNLRDKRIQENFMVI